MAEITRRQARELAHAAGIDLDDARADAIAARNSLRDAGATVLGIVMTGDG